MSITPTAQTAPARGAAAMHVRASNAASEHFFARHADAVAHACQAMAARFEEGGRLLVYGEGAQRSDVSHVVVEFVHPVIVGKRALPAMALESAAILDVLGRAGDVLLLLCVGRIAARHEELLHVAKSRGMLTLALTGARADVQADFHFAIGSDDALIVQETHEMLYHVLWELVHVFFREGRGG